MSQQRTALVIGGSGGIGRAVVARLRADGFFVCATYAQDGERVEGAKKTLGDQAIAWYALNLQDMDATARSLSLLLQEHPSIEAVVYGPSAPLTPAPLASTTWESFEDHWRVQVRGAWQVVRAVMNAANATTPRAWVSIVTEACIGRPPARLTSYVTAKYALLGFTNCLAVELGSKGWRVNSVLPGMVETDLIRPLPKKLIEMTAERHPLKRTVTPDDVASVVSFLLSDAAGSVHGAHIPVNGGSAG